jgi:hypothetical protein
VKATLIYDRSKWDGTFCREIVRFALQGKAELTILGVNPGDTVVPFPEEGPVYVCGLPLDEPFGKARSEPYDCPKHYHRLVWLHNDLDAIARTFTSVPGIRIPDVAVARLAYNWFVRQQANWDSGLSIEPPTQDDFRCHRVIEPPVLGLVQQISLWEYPPQIAREFFAGLACTPEADIYWALLLSPWSAQSDGFIEQMIDRGEKALRRSASAADLDQKDVSFKQPEGRKATDIELALLKELEQKEAVIKSLRAKLEKHFQEWLNAPEPQVRPPANTSPGV